MARRVVAVLWVAAIVTLVALGTWQVQRLAWKRALIAQVDARLAAAPVPAPRTAGPDDAYRRITANGRYVGTDSFVQASTVRGPGWWVMTPLRTPAATILVNRGYVAKRAAPPPPSGSVAVTGLLRLTEPGGGFLRSNDPAGDRWYSRDVAAIAARHGVGGVAPYFIDADVHCAATPPDHAPAQAAALAGERAVVGQGSGLRRSTDGCADAASPDAPVGGLTVVRFPNNHLPYAITWYILALMATAGLLHWLRTTR